MPSPRPILNDLTKNGLRFDKAHAVISADGTLKAPKVTPIIQTTTLNEYCVEPTTLKEDTIKVRTVDQIQLQAEVSDKIVETQPALEINNVDVVDEENKEIEKPKRQRKNKFDSKE